MNTLKRQPINPKKYLLLIAMCAWSTAVWAQPLSEQQVQNIVDQQFKPLLEQYRIAGLAVGVTLNGQHYFVNYGLASKQNQQPVNNKNLFELGSVSKLFNATLAGYAQATAKLSLSDHLQANSTQ